MNIYATLKEAIRDAEITRPDGVDDESMIDLLKKVLCFKTSYSSYELWVEHMNNRTMTKLGMIKLDGLIKGKWNTVYHDGKKYGVKIEEREVI